MKTCCEQVFYQGIDKVSKAVDEPPPPDDDPSVDGEPKAEGAEGEAGGEGGGDGAADAAEDPPTKEDDEAEEEEVEKVEMTDEELAARCADCYACFTPRLCCDWILRLWRNSEPTRNKYPCSVFAAHYFLSRVRAGQAFRCVLRICISPVTR